jgi:hypothetical protein
MRICGTEVELLALFQEKEDLLFRKSPVNMLNNMVELKLELADLQVAAT